MRSKTGQLVVEFCPNHHEDPMTTYQVDTAHSEVTFQVRHMMFAKVRGQFRNFTADVQYDEAAPQNSSFRVQVETASIDTREAKRDEHLKSPDFFESERYPHMVFQSKRIEAAGQGAYKVTGDLTIKDVTREVTLDVEASGGGKDPWGNARLGFSARGSINRLDWGLKWNQALEAGGVLVGEKVDITLEIEAVQKA
jgi:polyisoprenoid-binding protein YceI